MSFGESERKSIIYRLPGRAGEGGGKRTKTSSLQFFRTHLSRKCQVKNRLDLSAWEVRSVPYQSISQRWRLRSLTRPWRRVAGCRTDAGDRRRWGHLSGGDDNSGTVSALQSLRSLRKMAEHGPPGSPQIKLRAGHASQGCAPRAGVVGTQP